mmetsp:Transcript_19588/g.66626  ORF Transcript_19588/g.66626 Transcript_19588/m.66626 type:complete len:1156 (-) Transcript_19588:1583-5050(-)|eukprot:CAMPEP_0183790150 /NCGR_PEP_ID=MMETSP0803_2-20130417/830_1 /TAXON_ID=195967 /ORGANISM="Crustomastix stigmata, Strain CCMP3273" /LENGTH=1155 /DNA_ID=CAMNT_0026034341 /DNA_START=171 /DNA_END=3638 /DNA_ORIENTATION=+
MTTTEDLRTTEKFHNRSRVQVLLPAAREFIMSQLPDGLPTSSPVRAGSCQVCGFPGHTQETCAQLNTNKTRMQESDVVDAINCLPEEASMLGYLHKPRARALPGTYHTTALEVQSRRVHIPHTDSNNSAATAVGPKSAISSAEKRLDSLMTIKGDEQVQARNNLTLVDSDKEASYLSSSHDQGHMQPHLSREARQFQETKRETHVNIVSTLCPAVKQSSFSAKQVNVHAFEYSMQALCSELCEIRSTVRKIEKYQQSTIQLVECINAQKACVLLTEIAMLRTSLAKQVSRAENSERLVSSVQYCTTHSTCENYCCITSAPVSTTSRFTQTAFREEGDMTRCAPLSEARLHVRLPDQCIGETQKNMLPTTSSEQTLQSNSSMSAHKGHHLHENTTFEGAAGQLHLRHVSDSDGEFLLQQPHDYTPSSSKRTAVQPSKQFENTNHLSEERFLQSCSTKISSECAPVPEDNHAAPLEPSYLDPSSDAGQSNVSALETSSCNSMNSCNSTRGTENCSKADLLAGAPPVLRLFHLAFRAVFIAADLEGQNMLQQAANALSPTYSLAVLPFSGLFSSLYQIVSLSSLVIIFYGGKSTENSKTTCRLLQDTQLCISATGKAVHLLTPPAINYLCTKDVQVSHTEITDWSLAGILPTIYTILGVSDDFLHKVDMHLWSRIHDNRSLKTLEYCCAHGLSELSLHCVKGEQGARDIAALLEYNKSLTMLRLLGIDQLVLEVAVTRACASSTLHYLSLGGPYFPLIDVRSGVSEIVVKNSRTICTEDCRALALILSHNAHISSVLFQGAEGMKKSTARALLASICCQTTLSTTCGVPITLSQAACSRNLRVHKQMVNIVCAVALCRLLLSAQVLPVSSLQLNSCEIECCALIEILLQLPRTHVEKVQLSGSKLKEECIAALMLALTRAPKIWFIDISFCMLGDSGARILGNAIPKSPSLRVLRCGYNEISQQGAHLLARSLQASQLVELNLSGNKFPEQAIKVIASGLPGTKLRKLCLSDNFMSSNGVRHIAHAIAVGCKITELDLANNGIGAEGARSLAGCLSANTTLCVLNIKKNKIKAEGAFHLARMLHTNSTLERLLLARNVLGDKGAIALVKAMWLNKSITEIDLRDNSLSSEGFEFLMNEMRLSDRLQNKVCLMDNNSGL